MDTRTSIIKEEGDGKYNEYLTAENTDFIDDIKDEKRKWTQGKVKKHYSFRDVMDVALNTYNNLVAEKTWTSEKGNSDKKDDPKFLALAAQLDEIKKFLASGKSNNSTNQQQQPCTGWRYQNPENKKEIVRNDRT